MNELIIDHLSSGYAEKVILKELSIRAKPGETIVIMGPSGIGKTTLLLTILGILSPIKGRILLRDKDLTHVPIEDRNIGYLPQDYGLFPHLTVLDNVAFGLHVRGMSKNKRESLAIEMLKLVHLEELKSRKINQLSGGQQQRVGLARALAINPHLLLLDEPLSNIDSMTRYEVARELKTLFKKLQIPVILVTHNHEDALFLADQVVILMDGKIEQSGSLKELLEHPKSEIIQKLLRPYTS